MKKKYKPCCGKRCMVHGCKTQEEGGCYCLCRLKDYENNLIRLLNGTLYKSNDCFISDPKRNPVPLDGEEADKIKNQLENIKNEIKSYELD